MNHEDQHNELVEDVIESSGKKQAITSQGNVRYTYSAPGSSLMEDIRDHSCNRNAEKTTDPLVLDFGPTDSEITLCRVKRETSFAKKQKTNNWDVMHDSAIPGDGTHLGESPSMVNLVTFVVQNEDTQKPYGKLKEFMVPMSSWEPTTTTTTATIENNNIGTLLESKASFETQCEEASKPINSPSTSNGNHDNIFTISLSNASQNSLACSKSVEKQKSSSSIKNVLRKMAFWKKKSRDNISNLQLEPTDSNNSTNKI